MTSVYQFERLTLSDIDLVNGWIAWPHVAQWWIEAGGASSLVDPADFDDADFRMWLVSHEGRPFAYAQDYDPHLYPDHYFYDRPRRARGIDQFIGDPYMVGQGHGQAFIRQRLQALFDEGVAVVLTDPHPANARAIRVYKKAGFSAYGEADHPKYGPAVLMQCVKP